MRQKTSNPSADPVAIPRPDRKLNGESLEPREPLDIPTTGYTGSVWVLCPCGREFIASGLSDIALMDVELQAHQHICEAYIRRQAGGLINVRN